MEFLRKSETFQKSGKSNEFHYWSVAEDTLGLTYVGTLQARGTAMNGGKNLYELWSRIAVMDNVAAGSR
ncbi:hypothetical protein [Chitinophaga caseinilytica]|uniref:Uncharacterized protein n=1 Tax=Chitinophaga caseinilytica TaxID=2267521 RepID=A0ABZ2YZ34_9BACT